MGSSTSLGKDNQDFTKAIDVALQDVPLLEEKDPRIEQAVDEARLETYEVSLSKSLPLFGRKSDFIKRVHPTLNLKLFRKPSRPGLDVEFPRRFVPFN